MSRELDARIPEPLATALRPDGALEEGLTVLLLTVREDGWPHLAMLSVGEVVARDDTTLGLLLWPTSTSTQNLLRTGRATLSVVRDQASWTLRSTTRDEGRVDGEFGEFRRFAATVTGAAVDRAPYADLTSGVTFRLKDPDQVLPRWAAMRQVIARPTDDRRGPDR